MMAKHRRVLAKPRTKPKSKPTAKAKPKAKAKGKGKKDAAVEAVEEVREESGEEQGEGSGEDGGEGDPSDSEIDGVNLDHPDEWCKKVTEDDRWQVADEVGELCIHKKTSNTWEFQHPVSRVPLAVQNRIISSATGYESISIRCMLHGCRICVKVTRSPWLPEILQWAKEGLQHRSGAAGYADHQAALQALILD